VIRLPEKALIGMVHLPALPGTAGFNPRGPSDSSDKQDLLSAIIGRAVAESNRLADAGFDAVVVENFGDTPFLASTVEPHTVASMAQCVRALIDTARVPVCVNVLRNDALAALAVAATAGAHAIRVNVHMGVYATDQGMIEGRAAETLQYRQRRDADVAIWADVHVKHAQPLSQPDIVLAAEELVERGCADAVIVSGSTTGRSADLHELKLVKGAVPRCPVFVGSGVTTQNVRAYLELCDGVIVGSDLKQGGKAGNPLDADRAKRFVAAARS
jgi:membrane complex biogenesis BtpA family protein